MHRGQVQQWLLVVMVTAICLWIQLPGSNSGRRCAFISSLWVKQRELVDYCGRKNVELNECDLAGHMSCRIPSLHVMVYHFLSNKCKIMIRNHHLLSDVAIPLQCFKGCRITEVFRVSQKDDQESSWSGNMRNLLFPWKSPLSRKQQAGRLLEHTFPQETQNSSCQVTVAWPNITIPSAWGLKSYRCLWFWHIYMHSVW